MKIAIAKYPKRRAVIWPWVVMASLVLTTITPFAVLYAAIYDPATKAINYYDDMTINDLGMKAIVDSLDNTKTNKAINVVITEDDMDNILRFAMQKASGISSLINKAYVNIKGTNYTFYADIKTDFIRTRLKIATNMTEDLENHIFNFKIKDIGIGHITGIKDLASKVLSSLVPETVITELFTSAGLSMKFDKENFMFTYARSDLIKDLSGLTTDDQLGTYFTILETLMEKNLATFYWGSNNFVEAKIDLSRLETNELVTDDDDHIKVKSYEVDTQCKDRIVTLINNDILDPNEDNLDMIFGYFFGGYSALNDENKAIIDSKDFSSVGITNNSEYEGFGLNKDDDYLINSMQGRIMTFTDLLKGQKEISLLSENDLNTYIEGRNVIGFTTSLKRKAAEGYKYNYITVDNFYSNIYSKENPLDPSGPRNQIAEFVCKININGYSTSLTFETEVSTGEINSDSLTFYVKSDGINFGEINAPELNDEFFTLIADALNSGDSTISADTEHNCITMHLGTIVEKARTTIKDRFNSAIDDYIDRLPFPPSIARESPIPDLNYKTINQIVDEFETYVDGLFVNDNAEIHIIGDNRNVNGQMTLNLIENNPPEEATALVDLLSGS